MEYLIQKPKLQVLEQKVQNIICEDDKIYQVEIEKKKKITHLHEFLIF